MRLVGLAILWWLLPGSIAPELAAQVSPGPLARAHRDLEGTLKCTSCHGSGQDAMPARCVACHRDVGWLAERNRGLHGTAATKAEKCASCHPDHAGLEFKLIKWPDGTAERFDHRLVNWPLRQSHAKQTCGDCHKAGLRVSPAAALAPGGKSRWTGLEQTCASCHEDIHRGALGATCADCHDAGTWKATPGFKHDTTGYALTGKHLDVTCEACHAATRLPLKRDGQGRTIPIYRPVPHQTCTACHRDVHDGRFGGTCTSCHSTQGFQQVNPSGFDHARTPFPLKGKHRAVKCAGCHADFSTDRGRRPAASTCAACHQDVHGGAATVQGKSADCAACHTESQFSPSTFPLERHQNSRYPLEGKHQKTACTACHEKEVGAGPNPWGSSRIVLRPAFGTCSTCHGDDHGGQLRARPGKGECAECHAVTGWKPSRFGVEAHRTLTLPLEGRHAAIDCQACHGAERKGLRPLTPPGPLGKGRFAFTAIETGCVACHLDPHAGRFEAKGARPAARGCQSCHNATAFAPTAIDEAAHRAFRFSLTGAHRATPCAGCHQELDRRPPTRAGTTLVLAATQPAELRFEAKLACADCHRSVHGPQFDDRKDLGRCEACHTDDAFTPAGAFDHDRDAALALKGGHQKVACAGCHKSEPGPNGTTRVIYRPVASKCEACHKK